MKKGTYNSKKREPIIAEMEKLLTMLEKHAAYLAEVNKTIKKIDADAKKMETYYFTDWLDDHNHFKLDRPYNLLLQDPIHNALQDIHVEKVKLLKQIAGKLQ